MGETEIERMRRLLGELESKQRTQKAPAASCNAQRYRLSVHEEESQGASGRTSRYFSCRLQAEDGTTAVQDRPVPTGAAKALKSGRQSFADIADYEAYLDAVLAQAAFDKTCKLLTARERTGSEVRAALKRQGYAEGVAQEAVERARHCGLVDDGRYARSLISSKTRTGWGRNRIAARLKQAGVNLEDAGASSLEELTEEREHARALALARKRRLSDTKPVEKLARFLVGRGFSTGVSFKVAKQVVAESQCFGSDSV